MSEDDPFTRAAHKYDFRRRGPFEALGEWRKALIDHVADHDLAAAHELRVGRKQADWSPEDVQDFGRRMNSGQGRTRTGPLPPDQPIVSIKMGTMEPTDENFLAFAEEGFKSFAAMRTDLEPGRTLVILANVVLLTGEILVSPVNRSDRVATLKTMCQNMPVFGYCLFFDAFVHGITTIKGKEAATKTDALLAHIGTREIRITKARPYHLVGRRQKVVWDTPYEMDYRTRTRTIEGATEAEGFNFHDPYAELFVSTPPVQGKAS